MFWRKSRKATTGKSLELHQLDLNKLPILNNQEIIALLGLENRLKSIEKLSGAGSEYYNLLYAPALLKYVESVQLTPATASHHHACPGGQVAHTLNVIDIALRKRKSYNLPQQSIPEVIALQEHAWTFAIFTGALLNDIGKLVCSTKILLNTGDYWTPHDSSILNTGAKYYSIAFEQAPYKLTTRLSNGFLHLISPQGRGWLAKFPEILSQLTAWLAGETYEWGTIGEIIHQSDQESVANNLKLGSESKRFPGAPTIPLVDKLTTALRQLLDEGKLKINRLDGSAGWCDGAYTYLECGTVADAVRTHLLNAEAKEVPIDNSKLFDTWQEHGFVDITPDGDAIWYLTINGKLRLTVLKFETNRIFHPSRRPDTFSGTLEVSDKNPEAINHHAPGLDQRDEGVIGKNRSQHNTANFFDADGYEYTLFDGSPINALENTSNIHSRHTAKGDNSPSNLIDNNPIKEFSIESAAVDKAAKQPTSAKNTPDDLLTGLTLDDPELANHFLMWLKTGLHENRILVNRPDALLHIVKEGVLIPSPITFTKFARQFELLKPSEVDNSEIKVANKIQKMLERKMTKERLCLKTKSGLNIHTYLVQDELNASKIHGWLLPISVIYGDGPAPNPNPALKNLSGLLEKPSHKIQKSGYFLNLSGD
jgi:integrating conjugative element relaxase (TIGR03760 family)